MTGSPWMLVSAVFLGLMALVMLGFVARLGHDLPEVRSPSRDRRMLFALPIVGAFELAVGLFILTIPHGAGLSAALGPIGMGSVILGVSAAGYRIRRRMLPLFAAEPPRAARASRPLPPDNVCICQFTHDRPGVVGHHVTVSSMTNGACIVAGCGCRHDPGNIIYEE